MKTRLIMILLMLCSIQSFAKEKLQKSTLHISAMCDMCKERIEKAVKTNDVKKAKFNLKTKQLIVWHYASTTLQQIAESVAKAGYDSELTKASNNAYNNLPECCQYPRK